MRKVKEKFINGKLKSETVYFFNGWGEIRPIIKD